VNPDGAHPARPRPGSQEEPQLATELGLLRVGAELFDAGEFHAAHEQFETGWRAARARGAQAEAHVWRALVLVAGALHHHRRGRQRGRDALLERARREFASATSRHADDEARVAAASDASPTANPAPWWSRMALVWARAVATGDLDVDAPPQARRLLADALGPQGS
jgi:hypothetical protein